MYTSCFDIAGTLHLSELVSVMCTLPFSFKKTIVFAESLDTINGLEFVCQCSEVLFPAYFFLSGLLLLPSDHVYMAVVHMSALADDMPASATTSSNRMRMEHLATRKSMVRIFRDN